MDDQNKRLISAAEQRQTATEEGDYRRAKVWQMAFFSTNNTATNVFMFLMMNVAYYASGVVGLGTVIVSTVISGSRVFDGITDPIIGLWIDKTNGKFGKFRPFILGGYLLMSTTTALLFFTNHLVPEMFKLPYFIVLYVLYIVGYTFQTAVTKSGQSVITTDPSQRPLFSTFDISLTSILFAAVPMYLSNYLAPKYGSLNSSALFAEFTITAIIVTGILSAMAIAGIWSSDVSENFGTGKAVKITIKDMVTIIKGNRPLQMLILAASTEKLGMQIAMNSIVMVVLFGVIIGDFSLYGTLAGVMLIPNILIAVYGTRYASKVGTRKGFIVVTQLAILTFLGMFLMLWLGDPTTIRIGSWNFLTVSFILFYVVGNGLRTLSGGLVIPMIPDVTDYETHKTGRYAPGVMGTIFSFVDKMVSSLAQTVIGLTLAYVGFSEVFPDVNTTYTPGLFWAGMFLFVGVLVFAWIVALTAMKFYPLTKEKMADIQEDLKMRRRKERADAKKASEDVAM